MAYNLCIDWGNTRVKAGIFEGSNLIESRNFSDIEAEHGIDALITAYKPVKAILCSVTNSSSRIEPMLKSNIKYFFTLTNSTYVPVMNAYSGETLGADRLALATAAHLLYPEKNNLVIALGTCITYNFRSEETEPFRGGAISPGLQMRLQAMHHFTDKLPEVKVDGELLLLGYDTETCMRSGAVFGMAAEIDGMIENFASQYPDFNAILTGGDMAFFGSKLKSKIFADPDLLLKGLNLILKHNVPQLQ